MDGGILCHEPCVVDREILLLQEVDLGLECLLPTYAVRYQVSHPWGSGWHSRSMCDARQCGWRKGSLLRLLLSNSCISRCSRGVVVDLNGLCTLERLLWFDVVSLIGRELCWSRHCLHCCSSSFLSAVREGVGERRS